jgi:hypothetical protein
MTLKPIEDRDLAAYLFVYFKDETHSLYMALSRDGYSFTDINDGKPVMDGRKLAGQGGIRDTHIMRGPDGAFYLAMTDLHIFAREAGLRETEWERPGELYGWGNNRAIVLMKSFDLINWSHSIVRLDEVFPGLGDIGCVWAPETAWDEEAGRLMVYFTMRFGTGRNGLYYSYADEGFTRLETPPEPLFRYPREVSIIDGDITKAGDTYHLFYVAHEAENRFSGIKHAQSKQINRGYIYEDGWIDQESVACEAPNVWKRIGSDTYVLMVDIFGIETHNFGFYETRDFQHFESLGRFNEGPMKSTNFTSPKHAGVVPLTLAEAQNLAAHWNFEF